jgi:hypothetical protein
MLPFFLAIFLLPAFTFVNAQVSSPPAASQTQEQAATAAPDSGTPAAPADVPAAATQPESSAQPPWEAAKPAGDNESALESVSVAIPPVEPAAAPGTVTSSATTASAQPVTAAGVATVTASGTETPAVAGDPEAKPAADAEEPTFFNHKRENVLIIVLTLLAFISYFTYSAQKGKELFIRRISGLSAIDDAVGRATEMGRGVLYVPGIMDMDDIQTIAGVTILGHVAKKTAEYDTPLFAPMSRSFTMSVAQEVVKQSYLEKGRADAFRSDRINYLTDDQFGFVAGVGGIMMREKPAACFYLGTFYAESLILAETGNSVGAIQIAGTAEPSQIPFFVAACDYTLIGEELFAASAYLSKNPKEIGSLKGQDMSKLIIILFILIGTILVSVARPEWSDEKSSVRKLSKFYLDLLDRK